MAPSTSQLPSSRTITGPAAASGSDGISPTRLSSTSVGVTSPSMAPNSSSTSARCTGEFRNWSISWNTESVAGT